MAIKWELLNPIAPTNSLLTQGSDLMQKGFGGLADAVKGFGADTRTQNTNELLRSAMGVNSLEELPAAREGLMAAINQFGNGADGVKALEALNKQESNLYDTQKSINSLDQYGRGVAAEERVLADQKELANPDTVKKALAGDAVALDALSRLNNGSPLIEMYAKGVASKKEEERFNITRGDTLKQQTFSNNLAISNNDIQVSTLLNTDPGGQTLTYEKDANGNTVEVIKTNPSAADTYLAVAGSRNKDGSLNLGSAPNSNKGGTGAAANQTGNAKAVSDNLRSLSTNLKNDPVLRNAVNKLNVRDPKHLAMMAIESGGGGMGTTSFNGSSVGPMQLRRQDAAYYANKYGIKGDPLTSAEANIATGAAHVDYLSKRYDGNTDAIGIGYNGGEYAADVAFKAWNKAGRKGQVRDYVPSTYPSKGKTKKYDVAQMKGHAEKFTDAYGRLSNTKQLNGGSPTQATAAKPQAKAAGSSFSLAPGALATAQQTYQNSVKSNQSAVNSAGRLSETPVQQNALSNFMQDNGIKPSGSSWQSAVNDKQNVFNALKEDKNWQGLSSGDKLSTLQEAIKYTEANQGLGFWNPNDASIRDRSNRKLQDIVEAKKNSYTEKNYTELRKAADDLIKKEAANPKRKGKLPSQSELMKMIDPDMYKKLVEADKKVNNPF